MVAVFFPVTAFYFRMSGPENNVKHFRKPGCHLLHRSNGIFDPLVRPEQAEGKKQGPPFSLESVLVKGRIKKGDIGRPVRDHHYLGGGNAVNIFQKLHRHLSLHHYEGGEFADTGQSFFLPGSRFSEDGVESRHHRFFQAAQQVDNITAILSAEDAELMLQANHVNGRNVDKVGRPLVVAAMLISYMEAHFTAVTVSLRPVVQSNHFKNMRIVVVVTSAVKLPEVPGQIRRIGGNTAAAGRIGGDKGHLQRFEQIPKIHFYTSLLYFRIYYA